MQSTVIALAWPGAASGPLDPWAAALSFVIALAFTAAVAWGAHRLAQARTERQRSALAESTAATGVH